jgi:hypothetical protein
VPKVKYDVSNVESRKRPKPGLYPFKIVQATYRAERDNPDIEVVSEITSGEFKGSRMWSYIQVANEASAWKLREWVDALGLKGRGTLDTDKLVGKEFRAKVNAEQYQGEYSPKIGTVMALDAEDDYEDEADDEAAAADEAEAEDDEDDEGEEEELPAYEDMSLKDLRAHAKERGIETAGAKKTAIIEALEADDEEGADDEEEDEEEDGDEEEDEVVDYSEWERDDLKAEAKRRGIKVLKKHSDEDIATLLEEDDQAGDPFDGDDEEEE